MPTALRSGEDSAGSGIGCSRTRGGRAACGAHAPRVSYQVRSNLLAVAIGVARRCALDFVAQALPATACRALEALPFAPGIVSLPIALDVGLGGVPIAAPIRAGALRAVLVRG